MVQGEILTPKTNIRCEMLYLKRMSRRATHPLHEQQIVYGARGRNKKEINICKLKLSFRISKKVNVHFLILQLLLHQLTHCATFQQTRKQVIHLDQDDFWSIEDFENIVNDVDGKLR